jgi:hypothetical protein|nr:MAG TPA: hypothetical protein [Caudoviricetes sp.]DAO14315.1 MAG TPA: hypothetical protein [Caudoviricetes sp.]DAP39022.1 MAG TPA: hypothetical protein [Caudoviricetes sp.]
MPIVRQKNLSSKKEVKKVVKKKTTKASVGKKKAAQVGRNSDGTFSKGNKLSVGNNGGRPTEDMSFRHQVKIRASNDPNLVLNVINNLIAIASDPDHPKCVEAADKLIKLNGNYDPTETKDVSEKEIFNPFENLSEEELRKLAK